jgi:hypothetical protein
MEQFNVLVVRPPDGSSFHHAYTGIAGVLGAALKRLGFPTRIAENEVVHDATNVVLGAHNLETGLADALPANTIIYNTEMVVAESPFVPTLKVFVERFETWDYSERNVRAWREMGLGGRVRFLRPGYIPECTTIDPATPTDIDTLFYGLVTPRRQKVLDSLLQHGIRTCLLHNTYGAARDAYIARSKIVLNIHAAETSVFEIVRAAHVMSNHRLIVSEESPDASFDDLRDAIPMSGAADLGPLCRSFLDDDARRREIAELGFALFSRRDFLATLSGVLGERGRD